MYISATNVTVTSFNKITIHTTRDFIQNVHYYIRCTLLYRMFIIIKVVHYYMECALLYAVCIIIKVVHYYTGCALLYRMHIVI